MKTEEIRMLEYRKRILTVLRREKQCVQLRAYENGIETKNWENSSEFCDTQCTKGLIMSAARSNCTVKRRFFKTGIEFARNLYAFLFNAPSRN